MGVTQENVIWRLNTKENQVLQKTPPPPKEKSLWFCEQVLKPQTCAKTFAEGVEV
jgi:hypothetical protein